jgi:FkbM family methyltransferase
MRKIFLDCGGNLGRAVRAFLKKYKDSAEYQIFSFEPQTRLNKFYEGLTGPNIHLINKAVWTHDGEIEFHYTENVKGSTIFTDYAKAEGIVKTTKVPCLDLSTWVMRSFNPGDYIVLKMNIEGAEYPVLEKMADDKSLRYVNELYVSPHVKKIDSIPAARAKALTLRVEAFGIKIVWPPPWGVVRPKKYPFDKIGAP